LSRRVEVGRQDAQLQAIESRRVRRKALLANEAGPGTSLQRSPGACTQEKRTASRPPYVAFEKRQEQCL
jgi:hypothetical protein